MKRTIPAIIAACGLASLSTAAVNTQFTLEVSLDGTTFSSNVVASPGQVVQVRARVTYTGVTSEDRTVLINDPGDPDNGIPSSTHTETHTFVPRGLGQIIFQPTVSNWVSGDSMLPLQNNGAGGNLTTPTGVVSNANGQYGRIRPWGSVALTGLTGFVQSGGDAHGTPAGTWLRIAQPQVADWMGFGGNISGGSGVNIRQLAAEGRTGSDPAFVSSLTGISVFRFAIQIGSTTPTGDLVIDAPQSGLGNLADPSDPTSERQGHWWALDTTEFGTNPANLASSITEHVGSFQGGISVTDATIHVNVLPSPGALVMLGIGGALAARRRRS